MNQLLLKLNNNFFNEKIARAFDETVECVARVGVVQGWIGWLATTSVELLLPFRLGNSSCCP